MTLIQIATETQDRLDQATARIASLAGEHAQAIAAKNVEIAALQQSVADLQTLKTTMETQVATVLQSGDPAQYEALARAFLTPAEEKARLEKLARAEALRAEAAQLEAEAG